MYKISVKASKLKKKKSNLIVIRKSPQKIRKIVYLRLKSINKN